MSESSEMKVGFVIHITLMILKKSYHMFKPDHVVFCVDTGNSWRKYIYPRYKENRKVARDGLSQTEKEEMVLLFTALGDLQNFIRDKTNSSYLMAPGCEADDFIARWVQLHPNDEHVIVSTDGDFHQLINDKVKIYNGVKGELYTTVGVFNDKGGKAYKHVKGKKIEIEPVDSRYFLFEKCIRGDAGDNILPSYPGARKKGTKSTVGIDQAFKDMNEKGYDWNSFMNHRFTDHEGNEHRVLDRYLENVTLIDLAQQPDEIKQIMDMTIEQAKNKEHISQIGVYFMSFCSKYKLEKILKSPESFVEIFKYGIRSEANSY